MAYTTIDDPSAYFQTALYTGVGGAQDVTNTGNSDLQPDLAWICMRNSADNKIWFDSIRGATQRLLSNSAAAEVALSGNDRMVTAFNSDGLSLGGNSNATGNNKTFVAWQWKAGTAFSNDASSTSIGSIDSAGSVNQDAGFSIFTFTGTGSIGTIKHGLNTKPDVIFIKGRSEAKAWTVYHSSLGATKAVFLQATDAAVEHERYWNDVEPTTSVFTGGSSTNLTGSGITFVGYAFSEKQGYSKMGSYVGNGNADGNFIYTGFKPAWVILKGASGSGSSENWSIYDSKRLGYNVDNNVLDSNTTAAELTDDNIDLLSNGFKIRRATGLLNDTAVTYIYMAFAENPFVTSTGVPATAR